MKDEELDNALQTAKKPPSALLPPSFTRDVWRDIEKRSTGPAAWVDSLIELLALPLTRLALCALALLLGLLASTRSADSTDPVAVYAYSINPLAPATAP